MAEIVWLRFGRYPRRDSNPQPSGPKPDALSVELRGRVRPVRTEVYQSRLAAFDSRCRRWRPVGDSNVTLKPLHLGRNDPAAWRTAATGLVLAATIVGLAIVVGGTAARLLNPIGAVLWLASGVLLALSLPSVQRRALGWAVAIASGLILGALVRPSGLIEVALWFALAGAVVVIAAA